MHALQVLPILSFYLFRNTKATLAFAMVYALLAIAVLFLALNGRPLLKRSSGSGPPLSGAPVADDRTLPSGVPERV